MGEFDAVICGGGYAGLACAAALADVGSRVVVLEAHPRGLSPQFRGELIHPRGARDLDRLGLLSPLERAGSVDVAGFSVWASPDEDDVVLPYARGRGAGIGVDHHSMLGALHGVLRDRGIEVMLGERVSEILRSHDRVVGVRTESGLELRAELTIGADGRQSRVRKLLGIETDVKLLSHTVTVTVASRVLPRGPYGHVFLGGAGPVLVYPFSDDKARMCIDMPACAAKGREGVASYVREHHAPHLPREIREATLEALARGDFGGCATHAVTTLTCAVPGAILLGDAGGCAHPLTATGMTAAINDVHVLAACAGRLGFSDGALLRYQRTRYRFVRARAAFTEALYEVLRGSDEGARALQRGVFRYWRNSERARAASMGLLSGDDSRISVFITEYARVMGLSTLNVWSRSDGLRPRAATTSRMLMTSLGRLERAVEVAARAMMDERRARLTDLPLEAEVA